MTPLTNQEKRRTHELAQALNGPLGGCCWHVVISDGNPETAIVKSCLSNVDTSHAECVELGALLVRMSVTQRIKLINGGYARLVAELGKQGGGSGSV